MPKELESLTSVSLRIKNTRKALGISQKKLAKALGMSQSTIARLESDIVRLNPSYRTVFNVLDALQDSKTEGEEQSILNKPSKEIMHKNIIYVRPEDTVEKALRIIKEHDFTQIPVLNSRRGVVGTVNEKRLLKNATESPETMARTRVSQILDPALPQVDEETEVAKIRPILENFGAVLVMNGSRAVGIITIYDIMRLL
ncbi:MAG TPA: CBS domain-containing protein [Candidatus Saccharimonadales bacterium]|nr:CBS domain-containing protein [Candidatus Saccharimonadales bacterium]